MQDGKSAPVDCEKEPIYMDYEGYCDCKETPTGHRCNWISYFYDYEEAIEGNRNLKEE